MTKTQFPAEEVTLPSKGLLYSEDSPLKKGTVEMKYMTAREEDILTNANYIKNGVAIDKLLESLVVTDINFSDLLIGDKNAIMIAARILGYGAEYEVSMIHPETGVKETGIINLSNVEDKELDKNVIIDGQNEFEFTLPTSKTKVTFKLLTQGDEKRIQKEIEGLKKIKKSSSEGTVTLKHTILSVNGDSDTKTIRTFVDNELLARDARALRNYIQEIQPGINLQTEVEFKDGYVESNVTLPININFFWPDAGV
tara:strand:+ start:409 stop:1170 length:762 start_codon:yes stop_codon:yes gene_type:complete